MRIAWRLRRSDDRESVEAQRAWRRPASRAARFAGAALAASFVWLSVGVASAYAAPDTFVLAPIGTSGFSFSYTNNGELGSSPVNGLTINVSGGNPPVSGGALNGTSCTPTGAGGAIGCYPISVPVGATVAGNFTTMGTLPAASDMQVYTTTDSFASVMNTKGHDVTLKAVAPCLCSDLTASLGEPTIRALHGRWFSINVHWTMTCTLGAGGCAGRIKLETFPKDIKFLSPANKTIQCAAATCAATTTGQMRVDWLFTAKERPLANAPVSKLRKHKKPYPPVNVRLSLFCVGAMGKETLVHRPLLKIRFDRFGQVDMKHSILH